MKGRAVFALQMPANNTLYSCGNIVSPFYISLQYLVASNVSYLIIIPYLYNLLSHKEFEMFQYEKLTVFVICNKYAFKKDKIVEY